VNLFRSPDQSLGSLDAHSASRLVTAATDIALVLDHEGVIRDLALGSEEISAEDSGGWLGQPLVSTVSVESRPKVSELLQAGERQDRRRWRHLNHVTASGVDLPILYSAVPVGREGKLLALGRDMRGMADLQQRLLDVQQSIERDYSRLRHLETRYRLLFQMAGEAVLVVDGTTRKVVEANPAAVELLGVKVGQDFPAGFDAASGEQVQRLLGQVQALGRSDEVRARGSGGQEFLVCASLFRQDGNALLLVRLTPLAGGAAPAPRTRSRVLDVVDEAPDGFVVTATDGRILSANAAFLELVQLATEEQARGETLDRWLGRPGVDFNVLAANLREHGSVRLFATTLRGEYGSREEVEISAVCVPSGDPPCFGFIVRSVSRRPESGSRAARALPHSAEQLKDLVGRMPLKDLVRETTDLIEKLCIEAALDLTGDNRASAAEMLGLSRQSLYVKLRRYGLGDLEPDES